MLEFNDDKAEVEDCVREIAKKSRVEAFYPQTISRKLNIPIDIVLIELGKLRDGGKVNLRYEIKCLEDLNTIKTVDDYNEIIGRELFCDICGNEIEIDYNNIYPIFYINNKYREYVKKKAQVEV